MNFVGDEKAGKEEYSFVYGDESVSYEVVRKAIAEGKKRKITIKVHPDCSAVVNASEDADKAEIHAAVMKRAGWIYDALKEFKGHLEYVQPKHYVSGEMQFYLGRRYVLKVVENPEIFSSVKMLRGKLLVSLLRFDGRKKVRVQAMVRTWYNARAEKVFKERLQELVGQTPWVTEVPKHRILSMQKQWGSCSAGGSILLNPHLVKAPKECIDYVILHELCHIVEHNHSDKFYRLLTSVMPGWKDVKMKLDGMAELYLND